MGNYFAMLLLFFWLCVPTEAAYVQPIGSSADLSKCYDDPADFEAVCKTKFFGYVDGGRCYFVSVYEGTADWNAAWKACQKYDASLAQIYTASEYSKMAAYTVATWGSGVVTIALRDETTLPACVLQSPTIYFYDDVSTPNTLVRVNDTWLGRIHGCDDYHSEGPPRCVLYYISPPHIYDDVCNSKASYFSVCFATNAAQNYTKTNVCMNETPIQSQSVVSPQECAEMCSGERWCRSFNVITSAANTQCQLLTWAASDTNNTKPATPDCNCFSYVA